MSSSVAFISRWLLAVTLATGAWYESGPWTASICVFTLLYAEMINSVHWSNFWMLRRDVWGGEMIMKQRAIDDIEKMRRKR
jgi:hypothetical protein